MTPTVKNGRVLGAANRLLCCAVNDHRGLIATALANGAEVSMAIRNDEGEEARRG